VVVALDEETYRTPPFAGTPNIAWTREIGRVLGAIVGGGAKVVGFDIVYPHSIEESEIPFGDQALGAKLGGFDRDFLRALALASREGKVVLGEVQFGDQPMLPSPGQRVAVGQQKNIRALIVDPDADDIIRRLPLSFVVDGALVPSMAVELAARALASAPEFAPDGRMRLAGYPVPSAKPNTVTLNFEGGADDIPTFSLADLRACVEKGDKEFFRRQFDGKVVIFGTLTDTSEDLKVTSKRFATEPEGARAARCALAVPPGGPTFHPHFISGVYIHATAVNNLIQRNALTELGRIGAAVVAIAFSGLLAAAALWLAPVGAAIAYLGGVLVWTAVAAVAFTHALALPLTEPFLAGMFALAATIGYRFVIADKDKRFLRRSFALYLAPAVLEKMVATNKPPELGGETRIVTVYFSDVAGFSAFSEKLEPAEVVALMNEYLSAMADIIETHGGFVDKYIGDAIVAVFGAPHDDADHARNALRAALRCGQGLEEMNRSGTALMGHALGQRIGLNSGEALVGNIGSRRRFNYTAMGDTVNLASRLEGANKYFGTSIIASEATVALAGSAFVWRELDAIRVLGRSGSIKIYEPLAEVGQETADQLARAAAYAEGLARWRSADFADAVRSLERFAAVDPPSALLADRARKLAAHPPGPGWEPVNTLEGK
jgi:class 3 adenylate cyclase/CHASE2 domain-containing sensor protein